MTQHNLRLWALRQIVYRLIKGPIDHTDFRVLGTTFRDCVIRGHLTMESFWCMYEQYPMLHDVNALGKTDWVWQLALNHLRSLLVLGEEQSTYLAGYVRAQIAHLERCQSCVINVTDGIRQDVRLAQDVKELTAPYRAAMHDLPYSLDRQERIMRKVFARLDEENKK